MRGCTLVKKLCAANIADRATIRALYLGMMEYDKPRRVSSGHLGIVIYEAKVGGVGSAVASCWLFGGRDAPSGSLRRRTREGERVGLCYVFVV